MNITSIYLLILLSLMVFTNDCFAQKDYRTIRADSLIQQQNYQEAVNELEMLFSQDTFLYDVRFQLGELYYTIGDETSAKFVFNSLLLNPDYAVRCHNYLAIITESQGNIPLAIKHYMALTKAYPNNSLYLRKLGLLYTQGRELGEGIAYYRQAISKNPRDILALDQLSNVLLDIDSLSSSLTLVENGIRIDSNHIGLRLLAAKCHYKLKNYSDVVKVLNRVDMLIPLSGYYHKLLGYACIQIDSLDQGIRHLRLSLQEKTSPEYAYFYLGLAYERKKDFEVALYYFDEAAKAAISQNIFHYHQGKARQLTSLRKYNAAIAEYSTSQKYYEDPSVYYYMANLSEQSKSKSKEAIKYYTKFLGLKDLEPAKVEVAKERLRYLKDKEFMK